MKKLLSVLLVTTLLLTSCGSKDNKKSGDSDGFKMLYEIEVDNGGKAVSSARLQYGLASDTANAGILNTMWYEGNPDAVAMQFFDEELYVASKDRTYIQGKTDKSAAWYEMSDDLLTKTIHVNEGVKWHDGEELTVDDIVFALHVLANKDYTGVRYISPYNLIVGADEYNKGKADTISGIKKIDDYTLEINYTTATDEFLYISEYTLPEHVFKDIPIKDMGSSDAVRKNPIGFGAFKVTSIVPGEAITFDAFDDYYLGKPKMAGIDFKVVNPNVANQAINSGEFDMVENYSTTNFDPKNVGDNTQFVQKVLGAYNYTGFKLGKWDKELQKNVFDPNSKMADVKLRQAMGYAVDYDEIGTGLYDGLRMRANSVVVPTFPSYYNEDIKGFNFDQDKANKLLDEAGYKDVNDDGIREDKDGKEFVITAAFMSGQGAEDFANFFIQSWGEVGLKVELLDGRLTEFNSFYDLVQNDDERIDIYSAAWNTGYNPNPTGLWGEEAQFNYTRYVSDSMTELLDKINSDDALNDEKLKKELYNDWQELFVEEAPAIPTLYRTGLLPVNNRVKFFNWSYGTDGTRTMWHEIELTAEKPIKATDK